ncbi:MAG: hypothetical protein WBZ20_16565 [Nitrososphaeraceae archaeon]
MSNDLVVLGWVIGFATATILTIGIATYQNYKKYVERQQKQGHDARHKDSEQANEIEKWKRKVFRP